MVTKTSNAHKIEKPDCFGQLFDPKIDSCRQCHLSHDCMLEKSRLSVSPVVPTVPDEDMKGQQEPEATAEVSGLPNETQLAALVEGFGFRPGTQSALTVELLSTDWHTRTAVQEAAKSKFGGKGTGAVAALNKLVKGKVLKTKNIGRKKLYRIDREMWS